MREFGSSLWLITDDEQGCAEATARALHTLGASVALVCQRDHVAQVAPDRYTADLSDPVAVDALLHLVRGQSNQSITGLIHLLPLHAAANFDALDEAAWRAQLRLNIITLFTLAKALSSDLKAAAQVHKGWLVAATRMGGASGSDGRMASTFSPSHGGVAGLVKSLAREWSAVCCKTVDFDTTTPAAIAASVMQEIRGEAGAADSDGEVEVGYRAGRRLRLRAQRCPVERSATPQLAIEPDWIILVTGGARGITAEVACDLAARYRPTLLLVGTAPLPPATEADATRDLTAPAAIKTALIQHLRQVQPQVTPAQVEAAYARLLKEREMRHNLAQMLAAGATIHYYQVDVSDVLAFGALIDDIYQHFGRLDGVIHGAGIIEDKLIEGKTPDSFARVLATKCMSAFVLSRKLRPATLRFLVFFASVAGRFGNRGQTDYAAANEILNKLALHLDRQWPGRIVAINWGPWHKAGMVSPEVQRQFEARGVQLIPPDAGRRCFDEELRFGRKGEVEIIIGDGPWEKLPMPAQRANRASTPPSLPLLHQIATSARTQEPFEVNLPLMAAQLPYLRDHQLDGTPVLPAAMAVELMAEAVQHHWPAAELAAIHTLRVLRGIILHEAQRTLRLTLRPLPENVAGGEAAHAPRLVQVELHTLDQPHLVCYRAVVECRARESREDAPAPPAIPDVDALQPFPFSPIESYQRWLFHGPALQGIQHIEGINPQGISAWLQPSVPAQCLGMGAVGQWLIDPVLLDCSFQLAILWQRHYFDTTPLPSAFAVYRMFHPLPSAPVRCWFNALPGVTGDQVVANIYFLDSENRLLSQLAQMEFTCSRALNRLASGATQLAEVAYGKPG